MWDRGSALHALLPCSTVLLCRLKTVCRELVQCLVACADSHPPGRDNIELGTAVTYRAASYSGASPSTGPSQDTAAEPAAGPAAVDIQHQALATSKDKKTTDLQDIVRISCHGPCPFMRIFLLCPHVTALYAAWD